MLSRLEGFEGILREQANLAGEEYTKVRTEDSNEFNREGTYHMTCDLMLFIFYKPLFGHQKNTVANGATIAVAGCGNVLRILP